jgi:peroxiredoxin
MTNPQNQPPNRGKPSPVLIIFLIFPIIGIMAALAVVLSSGGAATNIAPTPAPVPLANMSLIGQSAPNFTLAGLDGHKLRLSSYRGRVVFVNFWATWCEPCQRELPAFEAFMAEQGEDGAMVLAVNAGETAEQVTAYFDDHQISGIPTPLDGDLEIYNRYNVELLPTTYVIDPAGVVRYAHLGEMTAEDLSAYVAELGDS